MIFYIICILTIAFICFIGYEFLKKPVLKYDYIDMIAYNKSIQGTDKKPLPMPSNRSELSVLLNIIADDQDDNVIVRILTEIYEQLITPQNELDILILTLSELLYGKAIKIKDEKESKEIYRASRITKRLAHNLYRRYQNKKPGYSNTKFLQFVD